MPTTAVQQGDRISERLLETAAVISWQLAELIPAPDPEPITVAALPPAASESAPLSQAEQRQPAVMQTETAPLATASIPVVVPAPLPAVQVEEPPPARPLAPPPAEIATPPEPLQAVIVTRPEPAQADFLIPTEPAQDFAAVAPADHEPEPVVAAPQVADVSTETASEPTPTAIPEPQAADVATETPAEPTPTVVVSLTSPETEVTAPPVPTPAPEVTAPDPVVAAPAPAVADTPAVATPAPETFVLPEVKIAALTPTALPPAKPLLARKAEERQVFASLGVPALRLTDTRPIPADRADPQEVEAIRETAPAAVAVEEDDIDEVNSASPLAPSETSELPMSTPLKIRALTRADIPPPEKFASLGPGVRSDTRNASALLPPEQQRVAYDAPVVVERPKSIGRRKYIEESKYSGLGSPEALLEALKHVGANAKSLGLPASLWCADFMNLVLKKSGLAATGSRAAKSYLKYGKQIDEPRVGAIAIFTRGKNGGHVGIVRGTDGNGNPIIVSGNYNRRVAEAVYPKSRVIAYVVPK